jgi:hypothetical protein
VIERKVAACDFLQTRRDEQGLPTLLGVARRIADHPQPARAAPLPVEGLPAVQGEREIEIWRCNASQCFVHIGALFARGSHEATAVICEKEASFHIQKRNEFARISREKTPRES